MTIRLKGLGLTFDDVLLIPKKTKAISRSLIDISTKLTPKIKLKIPIISANMDTVTESDMAIAIAKEGGIGIIHRFLSINDHVTEIKKVKKEGLIVGGAIGINGDHMERAEALIKAGVNAIVIDIAHGHSAYLILTLKALIRKFPKMEFIAGNVATADATKELIENGASAIKVGIGPGALCTTRVIAGSGVPQLTAISECAKVAKKKGIPIIADGGIKNSGDIVKALAVGASSVMIGAMFSGCKESPALTIFKNNKKFKLTRGMASLMSNHNRQLRDNCIDTDLQKYVAEGVEAIVPYKGSISDLLNQLVGGIKSGFSYSGAMNIKELWKNAEFIQITEKGMIESDHHDVDPL